MHNTNILTSLALAAFLHLMTTALFSKFILVSEPSFLKRIVCFSLLLLIPFIGAVINYKILKLNWFRNEDGSKRSGSASIDFLELDAIFNPGSKPVLEERQREKMEAKKEGEKL